MPFTFSHPAIVLPLKKILRDKVSLTGLCVGSLMPDFEYFIYMNIQSRIGHSMSGVWYFCLPLGLMICFIFHLIVKEPFISNLPHYFQKHLIELRESNWLQYFSNHWIIVCLSIIIGAYSHLFWDSFTHPNKFFVTLLKLDTLLPFFNVPISNFLQHFSTLIGGLFILIYLKKSPSTLVGIKKVKRNYWLKITSFSILILLIRILSVEKIVIGNVFVSGISAFMISIILVSFFEIKKV